MPDTTDDKTPQRQKKLAVESFIGALMPSARMMSLYKPGHPAVTPIVERVNNLLMKTLGQETTMVVDIKGKTASVEDMTLADTKDISQFGAALHTLGIGQVLFTNRLANEGMCEFLKVLTLKADESRSLTAIQQEIQKLKIAGLQMSFVVSFVDSGDTEAAGRKPGQLSEEQILAFAGAETLQDFLLLLFRQNEPLTGKEAEAVSMALDNTLHREMSLEQFQVSMPWDCYDARIRACWDRFMERQERPVKGCGSGPRRRLDRAAVVSQIGLFRDADLAELRAKMVQQKGEAVRLGLGTVHRVLQKPANAVQAAIALMAYGRLLSDLGNDGDIRSLFSEFRKWREPKPLSAKIVKLIGEKVLSARLAENLVAHMRGLEEKTPEFADMEDFMAALGAGGLPFFIEELRKLSEVNNRRKLCALLISVCRRLRDVQPLIAALSDQDWFLVRNAVMIIGDVNLPGTTKAIVPALRHEHQRVREEAVRSLGKIGDETVVNELAAFIRQWDKPQEVYMAITALSLLGRPGVDEKLIGAYNGINDYDTRIAIVTALSRVATEASLKFLGAAARKSFVEMLTGRNKALRSAARGSFEAVKKALKANG